MNAYEKFASVYDLFMEDVPYDDWCACIVKKLREAGIEEGIVCELGCGTGNMTARLAKAGYDMIGIDASEDMLAEAQRKELYRKHPELAAEDTAAAEHSESQNAQEQSDAETGTGQIRDILYLEQDMREFELYGTVRAVVSVCDSLNYITEEEDLLQVFRLVNNYLDPGGLFLFDVNTPARYEAIGDATIAENRPEGSFIWENYYDPEERLNQYDLTLFLPEETAGAAPVYRKYEEIHLERAYDEKTICRLLEKAGLKLLAVTEAYTDGPVNNATERLLYVAQEIRKTRENE